MKALLIILIALIAGGQEPARMSPEEFRRQMDEEKSKNPCFKKRGSTWHHIGWRNCLSFLPAEQMQGVWYTGVEESGFVPNANSVPLIRDIDGAHPEMETFLDASTVDGEVMRLTGQPARERCTRAFRLEFVGRRSAGMGLKENEISIVKQVIVADRLLSAKYLGKVRTKGVPGYDSECAEPEQVKE